MQYVHAVRNEAAPSPMASNIAVGIPTLERLIVPKIPDNGGVSGGTGFELVHYACIQRIRFALCMVGIPYHKMSVFPARRRIAKQGQKQVVQSKWSSGPAFSAPAKNGCCEYPLRCLFAGYSVVFTLSFKFRSFELT